MFDDPDPFATICPVQPPPEKRYTVVADRRPWPLLEELALWPVIVSRGSHRQYLDACVWICAELNRPALAVDKNIDEGSRAIVERRTVTEHLDNKEWVGDLINEADALLAEYRSGVELSYVERNIILPQLLNKDDNRRDSLPVEDLVVLLGRGADDIPMVKDYLDLLTEGGVSSAGRGLSVLEHESPLNRSAVRHLFHAVIKGAAPNAWRRFRETCHGG